MMTWEEAIEALRYRRNIINNVDIDWCANEIAAIDVVLSAFLPVSREQVKKVFFGCEYCDEEWGTCSPATNRFTMPPNGGIRFCPMCGRPFTDEAVEMVMERLEALKDGNTTD